MSLCMFLCTIGLLIFFVFLFFKDSVKCTIKKKKGMFLARVLNRFSAKYNERMHTRKKDFLLNGLLRYQGERGRRLRIVEIGAGSGANFEFFPAGSVVTCVEPNKETENFLLSNIGKYPQVTLQEFHVGFAEDMTFIESNSVDVVVCTLVLCSVKNIEKCLKEVIRILKPGGKYFCLEHVEESKHGTLIGALQSVLKKPWWCLTRCRLANNTAADIRAAGFSEVEIDSFDAIEMVEPRPIVPFLSTLTRPHIMGVATK